MKTHHSMSRQAALLVIVFGGVLASRSALADELDALHKIIDEAFQKKEWDLAIATCNKILQMTPRDSDTYYNRGQAYRFKKNFDSAAASYKQALAIDPRFARGHKGLGNLYRDQAKFDLAIPEFDKAIALDPDFSKSYGDRAWALWLKGDYQSAITDYNSAIRLEPTQARYYIGLGWILATCPDAKFRDGLKAWQLAKRGYELEPANGFALDTLAAAYAETKDFKQAVIWSEKALASKGLTNSQKKSFESRLAHYKKGMPFRWDGSSDPIHGGGDDP